ncbi:MAG: type II toxin-antitoxin system VapC family toxin [Candidatus Bathyarchaeia archaeon]
MATLDTDILVALLKGAPEAIEQVRALQDGGKRISTTMITAYELLKGAYISSRPDENLAKVRDSISNLQVLELSFGVAEEASKIYKELRDKGRLIGEFDILIAAMIRFYDESLVTRDEHFKSISGMKLIRW